MKQTSIYLMDSNAVVLESLSKLINRETDMRVAGQAEAGVSATAQIEILQPDVAIVDLGLAAISVLDLISVIRKKSAAIRILVLSMHDETLYGERARRNGANGYLMKEFAIDQVIGAIRWIVKGNIFATDQLATQTNGRTLLCMQP